MQDLPLFPLNTCLIGMAGTHNTLPMPCCGKAVHIFGNLKIS